MAARVTSLLLRLLLAAVFLLAGVVKVWDFTNHSWATPRFFEDIVNYQLVPWDVAVAMSVYLPWLEIAVALALLGRRLRLGALALIGGMLLLFLGALSAAWWRGLDVSCGCFGHEIERAAWWVPLGRDIVLLAMTAAAFALDVSRLRILAPTIPDC